MATPFRPWAAGALAGAITVPSETSDLADAPAADASDEVHARAIVALAGGRPVEVQLLYPDLGIGEPLAAVTARYDLDREALHAAARSALSAPDRVVTVEIAGRAPA